MNLKDRSSIGIISSIILMFVPSYSISQGHGIASEFVLYFPWMTLIQITPYTLDTPPHMRILPLYITVIISIPSYYILYYLFKFMNDSFDRIEGALKISSFAIIQMMVTLATFLSIEVPEERIYFPIPYLYFTLFFGFLAAKWYFTEGYKQSLEGYEIRSDVAEDEKT